MCISIYFGKQGCEQILACCCLAGIMKSTFMPGSGNWQIHFSNNILQIFEQGIKEENGLNAQLCIVWCHMLSALPVDDVKMPPPWFIMHYWCHSTKSFNAAVVFFSTKKSVKSRARRPSGLKQMPCNRNDPSLNVVGGCCGISTPYSYFLSLFIVLI